MNCSPGTLIYKILTESKRRLYRNSIEFKFYIYDRSINKPFTQLYARTAMTM